MKEKFLQWSLLLFLQFTVCLFAVKAQVVETADVERIISTLASDDMRGRAALSPDIARAADFIAEEFRQAGLQPYTEDTYRQTFEVTKVSTKSESITINGNALTADEFIILNSNPSLSWNQESEMEVLEIRAGEDFSDRFRDIVRDNPKPVLVWVDPSFAPMLARFKKIFSRENVIPKQANTTHTPSKVFAVKKKNTKRFEIEANTLHDDFSLFNVAAVIPGKSKADEFVVFSAHYDHIGIIDAVGQDSIANGADDDASGTTAMIALAKHFKKENINERTLIFVAFTAEEIGMFGSKYFSNNIDADKVTAMVNIEMIGKDSKFGPNTLYVTGYHHSNLAELMQENLKGTAFTFHPDPYPTQNLFYRSDNAVLAALGVPAHTFSTSQIDKDEYYHTVKDELSTLAIQNIKSSIEAIAKGVVGIVTGEQTPSRVEKLMD
ncbi:M20/M25/M40 family metallo-hydrolase [Sphingobacterium sp. DN00404]|uniref:M20/M25/M40 family metallo-hydrolase n=1 Tax=Sphingobacterium micropteri TaxID=2763501 RepID=A0ABR7YPU0_9SPHI|nr:M20/M25/M40 family metallo-hydrolase [Sphingobacterium micropteri]MBD1433355.1 M20/M25/M40 family metallo-hydrolase [Sphingobacterium micropteri]